MQYAGLILAVTLVIGAILFVRSRRVAVVFIKAPRLGILDLKAGAAASIIAEDTEALATILGPPTQSATAAPQCDVLFIYCDIAADGRVQNSDAQLRDLIRDSGATVAVVASENEGNAYVAASKDKSHGAANLVMTVQRKSRAFPSFFTRLFSEMKAGVSMPVAWARLAPQIPGFEHTECPATIFSCERGQIAFR
jgi:hypothetical protein